MINKEYYNAMSTLSDFREKYYQDKQFTSTLTSQKTKDITKVADFVDELFPPGEASIYSGRPEINNYEAVNTPAFLEVSLFSYDLAPQQIKIHVPILIETKN